ncbi:hypothetical protein ACXHPE_03985 [Vibrio cincinnatiensis]
MSSSKSKQSTTYNTTTNYEVNTLDGGAIESSFDFAKQQSADAFDFGSEALNTVDNVSAYAFDSIDSTVDKALASNNKTLATMSDLVKTTQTQGATELINANKDTMKTMYVTIGVVIVVMFVMMLLIRGR